MSIFIAEKDLPQELTNEQAVEAAYASELAEVASKLQRGLPTMIECDKDLAPFLFLNLRARLRNAGLRSIYLDGRPPQGEQPGPMQAGLIGTMIQQLRDAVRGAVERRVIVLPHLDLLTTSQGGLTAEAREVIPLLYENPELVWLGFKDPSFPVPRVIENLFPHRLSLLGIGRTRLRHLITQKESRKFGRQFNPWNLYKYVSGINAVRLRKLLSTLETEDYPTDPRNAYRQIRQATLGGTMEVPNVDLDKDIGGYDKVKKQLRQEILDVLSKRDQLSDAEEIARMEELIPRGMIMWGPPGTGKTFFAKAMAANLGAAITIVSGPELKSKWVGESLPWEEEVLVIVNGQAKRLPIGELVDKHVDTDEVLAWTADDEGRAFLAPVTGFLRHKGPDYIDVLVTETGRQVRVTGGHSLFVERDGRLTEVIADEIEPGKTRVAVPLRLKAPETVREINLVELLGEHDRVRVQGYDDLLRAAVGKIGKDQVERAVGIPLKKLQAAGHRPPVTLAQFGRLTQAAGLCPDGNLSLYCWHRRKNFPSVMPLTEELGEFLGTWVAEGSYTATGVRLSVHREEEAHVGGLCRRLFGHVTRYVKEDEEGIGDGVDLYISSTVLWRLMKEGLGMEDGAAAKRVPSLIFLAPLPVVAAFLRGYFSGDGTFSGKYIEASTVSQGLAKDIITLLQYFGIAARCRTKPERTGSTSYRVRFLWTEFLRRFMAQIGFTDPQRNQEVRHYLDNLKLHRQAQTPEGHIVNDVLWDLVVEKRREPYSREFVYDLSVPATERFLAGVGNIFVHNSEENLRRIFHQARQCAPSIIVFDELDSFASARGTYTGSGVEHSMVNQLLTEMDGFHKEELVFVIGTTNFVEILDPALLRPGRFEFHLHIPYPEDDDRREILKIYDKKMKLKMSAEALDYAVRRTGGSYITSTGTPFSGDHINALCRAVARIRLREGRTDETTPDDVERGLTEYEEQIDITEKDAVMVATHEAGHFICALCCANHQPPERITIQSKMPWAPFYTEWQKEDSRRVGHRRKEFLDHLVVLFGGIEAERRIFKDVTTGASGYGHQNSDLSRATQIAQMMVEVCGMGSANTGLRVFRNPKGERDILSGVQAEAIDRGINTLIAEAQAQAAAIIEKHEADLIKLRDELVEKKTIEGERVREIIADFHKRYPLPSADGQEKKEKPEKATKSAGKKRDAETTKS
jgi:ATP-dependent Zn protease/intein/homing endonuclease